MRRKVRVNKYFLALVLREWMDKWITFGESGLRASRAFQSDFAFLLGALLAHPDDPAVSGMGRVFINNKFDSMAPP